MAYLDMTDPEQKCPEQWRLYESNNVRACGRQESDGGSCDSVYYSSGATHKCVEGWLDIHITLLMALLVVGVVVVLQETKSMDHISME